MNKAILKVGGAIAVCAILVSVRFMGSDNSTSEKNEAKSPAANSIKVKSENLPTQLSKENITDLLSEVTKDAGSNLEFGHELRPADLIVSDVMSTQKFQDFYFEPHTKSAIEVVGSFSFIHQTESAKVISHKLAKWSRSFDRPISPGDALNLARKKTGLNESRDLRAPKVELKVLPNENRDDAKLVYWIDFSERTVVMNAENSEILFNYSKKRTLDRTPKITVYTGKDHVLHTKKFTDESDPATFPPAMHGVCQVIADKKSSKGIPLLINPEKCTKTVENSLAISHSDRASEEALSNSETVLKYYSEKHQRNSFDDRGSDIINVVHVGEGYDNAYWDEERSFMAYGDGDGNNTGSYTKALDIAGHEMTHGVTAATAKLIGVGEPGALNESYSDVIGVLISNQKAKKADWTLGKELSPEDDQDGREVGIRSISEPHRFKTSTFVDAEKTDEQERPFPEKMSELLAKDQKCDDDNDQCEVHGNSTIPSHAAYLIAEALQDKNAPLAKRFDKMGILYYTVLTQRLGPNDNFKAAAEDTITVCKMLVKKFTSEDCEKVAKAFKETEILTN